MTDDKRDELIIDMHGKVTQMYGVLYLNGMVAKVERHEIQLREGHLTCPVREVLKTHIDEQKAAETAAVDAGRDKRYGVPVWLFVVVGAFVLVEPFLARLVLK